MPGPASTIREKLSPTGGEKFGAIHSQAEKLSKADEACDAAKKIMEMNKRGELD